MTRSPGPSDLRAPPSAPERVWPIWPILAAAVIVFLVLRFRCASIPLERDEGEYAYIAQRMLQGEVPYRDIFDQKPPGVFAAYLIPVALFGASVQAIHGMMYLWTALTAWALFGAAREIADRQAAAWAVLIFVVITIEPSWLATAANTEQFMLLPIVLSVWLALRGCRSSRMAWWFGAGAAAMAACWFKQVAVTNIAFLVVLAELQWRFDGPHPGRRAARGLAFAGGMASAAIPVVIYFATHHSIEPFIDCVWRHNVTYATSVPWAIGLQLLGQSLARQAHALWPIWLLALVALLDWRRSTRFATAAGAAWLLTSAMGVSIGLYFRDHYFIQLAPPLALTAGIAAARLVARAKRPGAHVALGLATAALAIGMPILSNRKFFGAAGGREQSRLLYGSSPFAENDELAALIREQTRSDDRVLIFGSEPQLLFQSGRRSATRYILFYPLMMALPRELERQQEAFAEISGHPPRCVIWTNLQTSLLIQPETNRFLYDAVGGMLAKDYRIVAARLIDPGGIRMLTDPGEAQSAWIQSQRDPESLVVDMVVLMRK